MKRALNIVAVAALLMLASVAHSQESADLKFSGTVVNTTNPDKPTAALIEIVVVNHQCKITVAPPLAGSGDCHIKTFNAKSRQIKIISDGPPSIVWIGTVKGNFVSGTYTIEVANQTGDFYLVAEKLPQRVTPSEPPPTTRIPAAPLRTSCSPPIESSITGEVEGWDGETIFKLDNGQIWQQAEYDYTYFYEYHPDVTIYQTSAGCRTKVEDEEDTVVVKRIK